MITVAVEGDTDVPFVTRLCQASGFEVNAPIISTNGKDGLLPYIGGFARAGEGSPHLVVRDLDQDARCAGTWIQEQALRPGDYFSLRLAVRAVEAWFLADAKSAAKYLSVATRQIPSRPDEEQDPKLSIVAIARLSSKAAIRRAIVPPQNWSRKTGPGYSAWLLEAAQGWSVHDAVLRSPSLARAHARLCERWHQQTG